jgi:hypothetical protein
MAAGPAGRAQPAYPGLARRVLGDYAFSWAYLGCFVVVQLVYAQLSAHGQAELTAWASTSVVNLEHDPVGSLVVSAFITGGSPIVWTALIALALFGANRALGNGAVALVCLAGQVMGSLVSEGIVAYRVDAGQLPLSDRHLTDVGPSYVVMSAIVVAVLCGAWAARILAVVDLLILAFPGDIFGGLGRLDVAAVGHVIAAATAAACTAAIMVRRGRRARRRAAARRDR